MADKAWARGFNVVRLNQRNCGGTEHLSRGLYHSGLTADPRFVLTELRDHDGLRAFGVAGYSLGRQPGDEARGRAGRVGPARSAGLLRGVAGPRARGLRARDRASREPRLRVELLPQPAGPHAPQGARLPGHVRPAGPVEDLVDPRVRRALHRAPSRLRRRQRLLSPRQRHARHRSHRAARPHLDRGGRSRSSPRPSSPPLPSATTRTSPSSSARTAGTARSSSLQTATTATTPNGWWWSFSPHT